MRLKKAISICAVLAMATLLALTACTNTQSEGGDTTSGGDVAGLVNDGTLTILMSPDYPPFENIENGNIEGFDVDLGRAVAEKLGLKPEFVQQQVKTIVPAIAAGGTGDIGLSGFSVEPGRAQEVTFTDAYYTDNLGIAVMDSSPVNAENAKTALNEPSMVIAVQTGTTGEIFAQENFPEAIVQGYANSMDAFEALREGHVKAVCTNLAVVEHILADDYSDARLVLDVGTAEQYAAIVSPDNPELVEKVNKALSELQSEGVIQELMDKWF